MRRLLERTLLVIFVAWMGAPVLFADQDASDAKENEFVEPIISEETMPNGPGEYDLRMSIDYREKDDEAAAALPRVQFFFPIINRLSGEIDMRATYQELEDTSEYGFGDFAASLKWLVVEPEDIRPAFVLGGEVKFPTGSKNRELGEGVYEIEPFISVVRNFEHFLAQITLGWSIGVPENEGETDHSMTYDGVLAVPLFERKVHVLLELNGSAFVDTEEGDQIALSPGIKYNFTDEVFVAMGFPIGLNDNTADWGIVTQVQIGF